VRGRRGKVPKAYDIRAALRGKPKITSETTYEEFTEAGPTLTRFDKGKVSLGRFATPIPWENHPEGDELLYILDGKIDVILLRGVRPVRVPVKAGSNFLVPKGVWHRQVPRPVASVLSALPTARRR
jgi:mannose-6-phosphate isomerase-like protein (cupin superfamily)